MVTDRQVRRLREQRMTGKTLEAAAAAAGMSERTARTWQRGPLPSQGVRPRTWRTRADPFADVWATEIEPRLHADLDGRLQALTVFEWLCEHHPGRFQPGQLRTLSAACASGARVMGRTRRSSSSRRQCPAGKPPLISRTRPTSG